MRAFDQTFFADGIRVGTGGTGNEAGACRVNGEESGRNNNLPFNESPITEVGRLLIRVLQEIAFFWYSFALE
ncbi:hypothetical protein [Paraburkholderia sp. SOS3]|jgi:hypothetical protein|uniref:hypothetical protein n=1 Tax=Paraburkholderia sp. SOS3 TaxID=1926494 RepID=UPI0012EB8501|nr:hypothetical protein [Paraburkholderia sp. SOS3]